MMIKVNICIIWINFEHEVLKFYKTVDKHFKILINFSKFWVLNARFKFVVKKFWFANFYKNSSYIKLYFEGFRVIWKVRYSIPDDWCFSQVIMLCMTLRTVLSFYKKFFVIYSKSIISLLRPINSTPSPVSFTEFYLAQNHLGQQ